MFDRSIGLLASCALGASAFLLPPVVAVEDVEARPFFNNNGKDTRFTFPCPSCDFEYRTPYDDTVTSANKLLMDFHVADDNSGLQINDIFVYPRGRARNAAHLSPAELWLNMMPEYTSQEAIDHDEYPRVPLKVSSIGVVEIDRTRSADYTTHSLQLKISGLGQKTMDDLPVVYIQLLHSDVTDDLVILSVDVLPVEAVQEVIPISDSFPQFPELDSIPFEKPHRPECRLPGPFCALSRFIGSTFGASHRRPCPGRKPMDFDGEHLPTHRRPHFGRPEKHADEFSALPMPDAQAELLWRPHHGHGHGRHGHHHRHGFFHSVSRGILAVLIPIMAGITVGIIVSVLGLLFGRLLGYLWFTAFRGGRRGYVSVSAEEAFPNETKVSEEAEQPLPPYEDAPAYEETEEQKLSA